MPLIETEEATILAAVRLYARYLAGDNLQLTDPRTDPYLDIASSAGTLPLLTAEEVEEVGDRLNPVGENT